MQNDDDALDRTEQGLANADEAATKASDEIGQEIADLAWLMAKREGRAIVWRVLVLAGVFVHLRQLVASPDSIEPIDLAHAEGKRVVGMRWFHLIHSSEVLFQHYPAMVRENHLRQVA